eukprot:gnl/TRDRNA2_/TRDRNA2_199987_c0_seq1.p1 gnl/TRDRNA2_/TRDRNA2_199987_c0~~gnl/TRDRNA2_/TRDRNA2_199987_c0_seq1.p1  ORF type:complete len:397 (+),score=47.67 gnl/TRDRNA2_/TRDRNA2_199987_c0_seq1:68-1258(+)
MAGTGARARVDTPPPRKSGKQVSQDTSAIRRVRCLDDVENRDLTAKRNEFHFRTPIFVSLLERLLRDNRDLPMVCLQVNICQYLAVGVTAVYAVHLADTPYSASIRNGLGIAYVAGLLVLFFERFILMLHFSSHRPIYKYGWMNPLVNWLVAPFFGIPCGVYKLHHCIMHHIENNHELDISSTECYQRDSFLHFLCYWFRFAALIWVELPYYTYRTKRMHWCRRLMTGIGIWLLVVSALARFVSFGATMWVLVVPHIIAMTAMSFGNFSQHMFIDPQNPECNYGLSYNCIDTPVNQTTFNDGYHIVHHINAGLHWTEMPKWFYSHLEEHLASGAITFRDIHFFDVGILVMTGRLKRLAEHFVHLGSPDTAPTIEEVEEKLRSWLVKMPHVPATRSK